LESAILAPTNRDGRRGRLRRPRVELIRSPPPRF